MKLFQKYGLALLTSLLSVSVFAYNGGYENSLDYAKGPYDGCAGYGNYSLTAREESGTTIADNKYAQCKKLKSVNLANVTSIGNAAFAYSALESVTIPSTVKTMGYIAFGGCTNLTTATIETWAWYNENTEPFRSCTQLKTLRVSGGVPSGVDVKGLFPAVETLCCPTANIAEWRSYSSSWTVKSADSILVVSGGVLTKCNLNGNTTVALPTTVKAIGDYVFFGMTDLKSISIPSSVTNIGVKAFKGCTGLTSISLPDSIKTLASATFANCSNLKTINIPSGVTYIWGAQFENCTSLETITDMTGVTSIGTSAFAGCTSLISVPLPSKLKKIGDYAFFSCTKLNNPKLPASLTSIGTKAYKNCAAITGVTLPDNLTSMGSAAFFGCTSLASAYVPASLAKIPSCCYQGCTSLVKVRVYGSTTIGDSCFASCTALNEVNLGSLMNEIGAYAFMNCTALVGLTLPDSVSVMGKKAFKGCKALATITMSSAITAIPEESFNGCSELTKVWSAADIVSVGSSAFKGCTKLIKVGSLDSGVVDIIKTGKSWTAPKKKCVSSVPSMLYGELATGDGTYSLLVNPDGVTAYLTVMFADGAIVSKEVEIDVIDSYIIASTDESDYYVLSRQK